jgi:hypothetical protein
MSATLILVCNLALFVLALLAGKELAHLVCKFTLKETGVSMVSTLLLIVGGLLTLLAGSAHSSLLFEVIGTCGMVVFPFPFIWGYQKVKIKEYNKVYPPRQAY